MYNHDYGLEEHCVGRDDALDALKYSLFVQKLNEKLSLLTGCEARILTKNQEEEPMKNLYEVHLYKTNRYGDVLDESVSGRFLADSSRDARNKMLIKHGVVVDKAKDSGYVFFVKAYERMAD